MQQLAESSSPTAASAALSDADIRHVAKLSRLALPDDQVHRYARQLHTILEYVAKIGEVDTADVEPTAHVVHMSNVFRDDEVGPSLSLEDVLRNAPNTDPPYFRVPKILGGDEDSAG